jgi:hypothetical protein
MLVILEWIMSWISTNIPDYSGTLGIVQRYKMPSLLPFIPNHFLKETNSKILEKIKFLLPVHAAWMFHEHKMNKTSNNFSPAKKEWPKKPSMLNITSECYNLNQAQTWLRPKQYLCLQAQAQASGRVKGRLTARPKPVQSSMYSDTNIHF